ncbi:MAG: hypothetical protein AAFY28_14040 [Actinomycetota bacterium]
MFMPDPLDKWRNQMLQELERMIGQVEDMIDQVDAMLARATQIEDALDGLELSVRSAVLSTFMSPIVTQWEGPADQTFMQAIEDLEAGLLDGADPDLAHDEQWQANREAYYTYVRQNVLGPYHSFKAISLSLLEYEAEVLAKHLDITGDDADDDDIELFYDAMWTSALYYESVATMSMRMLNELNYYWAATDDEFATFWLTQAEAMRADFDDYRRSLYRIAGNPDHDTVWHISTVGDEPGSVTVFRDDEDLGQIEDHAFVYPDDDVVELTLTADRNDVPSTGWALLAEPAPGGAPFAGWSASDDTATTTIEVTSEDWTLLTARFEQPWSKLEMTVDGEGEIEVWEDGDIAYVLDDTVAPDEIVGTVISDELAVLVLTEDEEVAAQAEMALFVRNGSLQSWSDQLPAGEHDLIVEPGLQIDLDVRFDGAGSETAEASPHDPTGSVQLSNADDSNPPSYQPPDLSWDQRDDVQMWWNIGTLGGFALFDAIGAFNKDLADAKKLRTLGKFGIRPDFAKYAIGGGVLLALTALEVILILTNDSPTFEELLGEAVMALDERLFYLDVGLDHLEQSLDHILNRVDLAEFRILHDLAVGEGTGHTTGYHQILATAIDQHEELPGGHAMDMLADDILATVGEEYNYLKKEVPNLVRAYAEALVLTGEANADDFVRYGNVYDYAAFWLMQINQTVTVLSEAWTYRIGHEDTSDTMRGIYERDMENFLADVHEFSVSLLEPLGVPLGSATLTTIGECTATQSPLDPDCLLIARDYQVAPDGAAADLVGLNATMSREEFEDLAKLSERAPGDTMQERLANLGIVVPEVIELSDPDESFKYESYFLGRVPPNWNHVEPCSWSGFTIDHSIGSAVKNSSGQGGFAYSRSYRSGEAHCVGQLHLTGSYGFTLNDPNDRVPDRHLMPAISITAIDDFEYSTIGYASLPSNAWALSGGVFELWHDNAKVTEITESDLYTPGIVDEVTVTTDPDHIANEGWTILGRSDDGTPVEFFGLHNGAETATLELSERAYNQFFLQRVEVVDTVELTVDVAGDGEVLAAHDGKLIGAFTADDRTLDVPADVEEIVFTTDSAQISQTGLVLVATGHDDPFTMWTGPYDGSETARIPVDPDALPPIVAMFGNVAFLDLDVGTGGFVEFHADGVQVNELTPESSGLEMVTGSEIMLLDVDDPVPGQGVALRPVALDDGAFAGWSDGQGPRPPGTASTSPGEVLNLTADFRAEIVVDVAMDGPGQVEAYRDGLRREDVSLVDGTVDVPAGFVTFVEHGTPVPTDGWALVPVGHHDLLPIWTGVDVGEPVMPEASERLAAAVEFEPGPGATLVHLDAPIGHLDVYADADLRWTITEATDVALTNDVLFTSDEDDVRAAGWTVVARTPWHLTVADWTADGAPTDLLELVAGAAVTVGGSVTHAPIDATAMSIEWPYADLQLVNTSMSTSPESATDTIVFDGRVDWWGEDREFEYDGNVTRIAVDVAPDGTVTGGSVAGSQTEQDIRGHHGGARSINRVVSGEFDESANELTLRLGSAGVVNNYTHDVRFRLI